jgi:aminoglycoside phosphotransferase (APT) family kinase protein
VPVAPALGYCDDESVNEMPFYVMGFVEGHVVRERAAAEAVFTVDQRRHASESIVDTLAAIHAVDLDTVFTAVGKVTSGAMSEDLGGRPGSVEAA